MTSMSLIRAALEYSRGGYARNCPAHIEHHNAAPVCLRESVA